MTTFNAPPHGFRAAASIARSLSSGRSMPFPLSPIVMTLCRGQTFALRSLRVIFSQVSVSEWLTASDTIHDKVPAKR
jgi:hypothetical protein